MRYGFGEKPVDEVEVELDLEGSEKCVIQGSI